MEFVEFPLTDKVAVFVKNGLPEVPTAAAAVRVIEGAVSVTDFSMMFSLPVVVSDMVPVVVPTLIALATVIPATVVVPLVVLVVTPDSLNKTVPLVSVNTPLTVTGWADASENVPAPPAEEVKRLRALPALAASLIVTAPPEFTVKVLTAVLAVIKPGALSVAAVPVIVAKPVMVPVPVLLAVKSTVPVPATLPATAMLPPAVTDRVPPVARLELLIINEPGVVTNKEALDEVPVKASPVAEIASGASAVPLT
jgi:hypothetical protein